MPTDSWEEVYTGKIGENTCGLNMTEHDTVEILNNLELFESKLLKAKSKGIQKGNRKDFDSRGEFYPGFQVP